MNLVSANNLCLQEFVNVSTTCGGKNTGSYWITDPWDAGIGILTDGNYNTGACSGSPGETANFFANYTKPANASFAYLQVNRTSPYQINLTLNIPKDGLSGQNLSIKIADEDAAYSMNVSYYNYTKNGFQELDYRAGTIYMNCFSEESVVWVYPYVELNKSYSSSIYEGSPNSLSLNISYLPSYYSSVTAILYYNNTAYPSTLSGTGTNITFINSITTPTITVATSNMSFWWQLQLFDGVNYEYYNTSINNQTVLNSVVDDCSVGTVPLFNFTIYDEDTLVRLKTPTWNQTYEFEMYLNDVLTYALNKSNVNEFRICLSNTPTGNQSLDFSLRYDADSTGTDYVSEYYNVRDYNLNNYTTNQTISLYDLSTINSEECLFTIKDNNFLPLTDAIVEIKRKYLSDGTFKVIEIPLTDSLGKAIGHFVLNDETYSIYLRKNNNLVASYINVKAVKPTGSDCVFNLNIPSASSTPEDFTTYGNLLLGTAEYDDATRTYTLDWVINSGTSTNITLYAYIDGSVVCSNSITATSGTSTCVFDSRYQNKTALLVLVNTNTDVFNDYVNIGYKRANLNPIRYIIASALLPLIVIMAGSSIVMATVFFILGLIIASGLALFDTESLIGTGSFIMWIVIGALILLFKFTRSRSNG
jgi:hypothetical protein